MIGSIRSRFSAAGAIPTLLTWLLWLLIGFELLFLLLYRQVNLDEGWYLWASKLVYEGKVLYRDFAYTQTPVLPYVYGAFLRLFGAGLYQGRILTVLCAFGAYWLSVATARQVGGESAGIYCLALFVTSTFAVAQYTYTATYALAALLIAAAIYVAVQDWPTLLRGGAATLLLATAVGVRLSVIVALPPFLLYLVLTSRQRIKMALWTALVLVAWFSLILGVFWLRGGPLMYYDIVGFHTDRLLKAEWQILRVQYILHKTLLDFRVLVALGVGGALLALLRLVKLRRLPMYDKTRASSLLQLTLFVIALALFAVHLSPRTTDSYYNALQAPMLSLVAALALTQMSLALNPPYRRYWLGLGLLLILANGIVQTQAFLRDEYVLYVYPQPSQIDTVRRAAHFLQQYTHPGEQILSFDTHLALEAGLQVLPGYEMSIFAYHPTWTDEEAANHRVVNNARLLQDLQRGIPVVAFTQFDLNQVYGERDAVLRLLQEKYRWFKSVPNFGPMGDELRIFLRPQFAAPQPAIAHPVKLKDGLSFLGYDLFRHTDHTGEMLDLGLYWHTEQPPKQAYTVFVQLLDSAGGLAVGWDNQPCHNTCPTNSWQAGEYLRDEYTLPLSKLTPGAPYTLQVGMYDPNTLQRVPLLNAKDQVTGDAVVLTTLTR